MENQNDYYKTEESADAYIKMAEGIDGREQIEKLKPFLGPNANILELGTGPGADWKLLSESYKVVGSDNSPAFLSRLKQKFPKGRFIEVDAVTLILTNQFDAIYSNKVLHHLTDDELRISIINQCKALVENGIICHTFWRGNGTENFKGMFVNNHQQADLNQFFGEKFEILTIENYQEFEQNDSILLIAKKK